MLKLTTSNHQRELKRQASLSERGIYKTSTQQRTHIYNVQELRQMNKKIRNYRKMSQILEQTLDKREHPNGQHTYEKGLSSPGTNQSLSARPLHPSGYLKCTRQME